MMSRISVLLVALAALFELHNAAAQLNAADTKMPTLIVTGTGEAKTSPDVAYVTLGMLNQGRNAAEASQENAALSQRISDALKRQGIADKDLQTSNYNIQPLYKENNPARGIAGYQVSNQVRATVRKLATVGKIIDAGLDAGANNVQGVYFGLEERSVAEEMALTNAVGEARRKAEAMAKAAGVRLVGIQQISTGVGRGPVPLMEAGIAPMSMARADTPISPGEMSVSETVTVVYKINEPGSRAEMLRERRLADLTDRRAVLQLEREKMAVTYSSTHPKIMEVAAQLRELDRQIAALSEAK